MYMVQLHKVNTALEEKLLSMFLDNSLLVVIEFTHYRNSKHLQIV